MDQIPESLKCESSDMRLTPRASVVFGVGQKAQKEDRESNQHSAETKRWFLIRCLGAIERPRPGTKNDRAVIARPLQLLSLKSRCGHRRHDYLGHRDRRPVRDRRQHHHVLRRDRHRQLDAVLLHSTRRRHLCPASTTLPQLL